MNNRIRYTVRDFAFLFWGFTDSVFNHSALGMIGQIVFLLVSFAYCLKSVSFKLHYVFLLYILFCIACWLNIELGFSIAPSESSFMLKVLLRNLLFLFFLFQYFSSIDYQKLRELFIVYCLISSIGLLLLNYVNTGTFVMRDVDNSINGNVQAINDSIAIGWLLVDRKKNNNLKSLFLVAFFLIFCLLAGTKKAFIGVIVIISVYVLLSSPKKIVKNIVLVGALITVVYLLMMRVPFLYDLIGNRFESLFGFISESETDNSTFSRNKFIEIGMAMFKDSPVWGHGINTFKELTESSGTYSHNNYVELLFSVGLVGTILYYLIFFFPLVSSIKQYMENKNKTIVFSIALLTSCLLMDYALVSYYERATLVRIMIIYYLSDNLIRSRS